jgi:hypothetical protein
MLCTISSFEEIALVPPSIPRRERIGVGTSKGPRKFLSAARKQVLIPAMFDIMISKEGSVGAR